MKPDSLRIEADSNEVRHLTMVGTVPGIAPLLAAARNGAGIGTLLCSGGGLLSWRAPGSETFGNPVDCSIDGQYVLCDGEDTHKFIRVEVHADYLVDGSQADVLLADVYNNDIGGPDIIASEAIAGNVRSSGLILRNTASSDFSRLVIWLDPASDARISISLDGETWSHPTNEDEGLEIPLLPSGQSVPFWTRRTIDAGEPASAAQLVFFHLAFDGLPN
jgi:hypothetical protein